MCITLFSKKEIIKIDNKCCIKLCYFMIFYEISFVLIVEICYNVGMKKSNYNIFKTNDGWKSKRQDADKSFRIFPTQKEAIDATKKVLNNNNGGELIIHGHDGKIREKNTILPAVDPFPPRG